MIVALVVGIAGGYFLRWGTEPTKTATTTVTKTVAPEPYVGDSADLVVKFTGTYLGACALSGPTEIPVGTPVTFIYESAIRGSTMMLYEVAPGTTYREVARANNINNPPSAFTGRYMTTRPRNDVNQTLELDGLPAGLWVVTCSMNPNTTKGDVFTAGMVRVVGV